ncbi:MAG: T9SS type A sorting domain-containing protein [Burkholderiales bacterium]|nr:T9SS type A sorting domain-containing protein [Bacteroidia bacterium]
MATNDLILYPNPSAGIINFITSAFGERPFSIYLYSTLGQKVFEKANVTTKESELNLTDLPTGTYFITFSNGNKTITKTIILN